jgi:hypothetical protein
LTQQVVVCYFLTIHSYCRVKDQLRDLNNIGAAVAQLGERTTEDRKVPGSIPGRGTLFGKFFLQHEL